MPIFVSESAPYATTCDDCGRTVDATVTEALVGDDHRWDLDARCPHCDLAWSECGIHPPAPGMRAAILSANGTTVLAVERDSVPLASVRRAVRTARPLPLTEARALADELTTTGIAGTLVEMEIIARLVRTAGAAATIGKRGSTDTDR